MKRNDGGQRMGGMALSSSGLPSLKYYLLALLLVATGVIVRIMLTHLVGAGLPTYITFYPFVMLAALVGGWGPGFLATLASVTVVDYWLLLPVGLFKIDSRVEIVGVAFFGAMGMFMSIVAELYRRTRDHLEELVSLRTTALSQANEQLQEQGKKLQAQTEELTAVNAALRESEQRWATTLGSIGDAVIATDLAGRITFMNAVAEGLTGWAFHEALQKPVTAVFNVINEKTRREVENPVTRVLQERRIVGLANHTVLVRKDGTQVPIDDSGSPIKGDKGNIMGVVLIFRDITERKKAEDELRDNEARLRLALDSADAGMWQWDLPTNKNVGSEQLWRLYGLPPHGCEPSYDDWLAPIHPDDREMAEQTMQEAARSGRELNFEYRVVEDSGKARWLMSRGRPFFDIEGKPVRYIGIVIDITERKRAEEALRTSEAGLARAEAISHLANWEVEVGADGILGTEDDTVHGSAELYRMFNLEKHHNLGVYIDKFHPEDRAYVVESIHAAIYEGKPYKVEYRIIPRAREIRHVYAEGEVIRDEKGCPVKFFGTVQDITDRKRMEEELRKSRDELEVRVQERTAELKEKSRILESFFTSTITPLVFLDRNFNFIRVNEAYAKCCQRDIREFEGHNHFEFYAHEENEAIFRKVVETKVPYQAIAKPFTFPDHPEWGTTYWDWTLTPLLDASGEVEFLVFSLEDVTKRKQAEEELQKAHDQVRFFASQCMTAQETERRRIAGELHDSVAASLGALRFIIDKIAEEMKQGHASPESLQDLGSKVMEINNETRRIMSALRPSMLDDLGIVPTLNWFCREYQKTYSHISVQNQIEVSDPEVPDSLKTPIFRICQEAMNNIAKYSKAMRVSLRLQKANSALELTIQDNGQGFDLDAVKKGMGLSTMRERAEFTGGKCSIESVKGAGTTIRCAWPLT